MMCSHPGYTNGVLTPSYAILTDACISKRNWGVEVFEETQGTLKAAAAMRYKSRDFYRGRGGGV